MSVWAALPLSFLCVKVHRYIAGLCVSTKPSPSLASAHSPQVVLRGRKKNKGSETGRFGGSDRSDFSQTYLHPDWEGQQSDNFAFSSLRKG